MLGKILKFIGIAVLVVMAIVVIVPLLTVGGFFGFPILSLIIKIAIPVLVVVLLIVLIKKLKK